jgi:hypothetical protein
MKAAPDLSRIELLHPLVAEILRKKTPTERLAMAFESNRFVRARLKAHLRDQHPEWSDEQIRAEIARRVQRGSG